jgi:nicotinamide-nucleotide amidase
MPRIQIINTGTELMLGRVLNTHQQWLCRQLADHGYLVQRQIAVADTGEAIVNAVRDSLAQAEVVITTGGLGPTSDDLTRDLVAQLLGRQLTTDERVLRHIEQYFLSRRRPQPESTKVQALVPEGATVLMNAFGTAPGLILEIPPHQFNPTDRTAWLIMLPGPPRELRPMFSDQVLPQVTRRFPLPSTYVCRTLRTTGMGESKLEEAIAQPLKALTDAGLELGYCARMGEVDVRVSACGPHASTLVASAEKMIRALLAQYIYTAEEESLEQVVVRLLTKRQQTLAVAESCTGGCLAHRLTNVPGASAVFWGGWITYANTAKLQELGVSAATLETLGAVSEPTAQTMAEGARAGADADYALAITGIAGPAGGSPEKPVGTVFIGLATRTKTVVVQQLNQMDRETFKYVTTQQALELLRRELLAEQVTPA